ncbi:MAG: glycosyltransferase [Richelia sp. RM2_1_2]|nr:glycosyltransferase [Richelia sp. RM2_1_2]
MNQVANIIQSQSPPLVSIIINNYNYSRFLKEAIDSALNQTYTNVEVIVVDDGSTDNSHGIITSYGEKIIAVLKENGGQASAINAGFVASKGEIIFFLDSDDVFLLDKVSRIVNFFAQVTSQNPDVTIFNSMEAIDENSSLIDIEINNTCELSDLCYQRAINKSQNQILIKISSPDEVYQHASKYRYVPYLASPTTGLAISRSLAEQIFPLPSEGIRTSADDFLVKAAALLGNIYSTDCILSRYRIHGNNNWYGNKKPHQEQFLVTLDNFLNSKLTNKKKKPVLSYFNSLHAKNIINLALIIKTTIISCCS